MKKSRMVASGLGLLIIGGALGFGVGRTSSTAAIRKTGQADLMQGYALFNEADHALRQGQHLAAQTWSSEGTAYILSAVAPLSQVGISGTSTISDYLQTAQYDIVTGQASSHQKHVLQAFQQSLARYVHKNYGTISDAALQTAFSRIQSVIAR